MQRKGIDFDIAFEQKDKWMATSPVTTGKKLFTVNVNKKMFGICKKLQMSWKEMHVSFSKEKVTLALTNGFYTTFLQIEIDADIPETAFTLQKKQALMLLEKLSFSLCENEGMYYLQSGEDVRVQFFPKIAEPVYVPVETEKCWVNINELSRCLDWCQEWWQKIGTVEWQPTIGKMFIKSLLEQTDMYEFEIPIQESATTDVAISIQWIEVFLEKLPPHIRSFEIVRIDGNRFAGQSMTYKFYAGAAPIYMKI